MLKGHHAQLITRTANVERRIEQNLRSPAQNTDYT